MESNKEQSGTNWCSLFETQTEYFTIILYIRCSKWNMTKYNQPFPCVNFVSSTAISNKVYWAGNYLYLICHKNDAFKNVILIAVTNDATSSVEIT
jgi:hypothetical protein